MAAVQFERDLRGVLPTIQVPTLVLHRAGDPLYPGWSRPLSRRAHPWGEVRPSFKVRITCST